MQVLAQQPRTTNLTESLRPYGFDPLAAAKHDAGQALAAFYSIHNVARAPSAMPAFVSHHEERHKAALRSARTTDAAIAAYNAKAAQLRGWAKLTPRALAAEIDAWAAEAEAANAASAPPPPAKPYVPTAEDIAAIVEDLRDQGVAITLNGNDVILSPADAVPANTLAVLRLYKDAVRAYLRAGSVTL